MAEIILLAPPKKLKTHEVLAQQASLYRELSKILRSQDMHKQSDSLLKATYYVSKVARELEGME